MPNERPYPVNVVVFFPSNDDDSRPIFRFTIGRIKRRGLGDRWQVDLHATEERENGEVLTEDFATETCATHEMRDAVTNCISAVNDMTCAAINDPDIADIDDKNFWQELHEALTETDPQGAKLLCAMFVEWELS